MTAATETRDTRELPGIGTLTFEESETRRAYWLLKDGAQRRTRLPSVTTILGATWPKPGLLEWYRIHGADAVRLRDEAAERGKRVHAFVESYFRSGDTRPLTDFPTTDWPYLEAAARFLWDFQPQPVEVELLVCHPEDGYAGRLDLIADVMGARTLLDYKSNPKGRIYTQAHVQATAYRLAAERCGGDPVEAGLLVGLGEDGTYSPVIAQDASHVWASTLDFHRAMARFNRELNGGSS